jgi:hypothetical protein
LLAEPSSADLYTVEELLTAMGIIAQGLVKNVKFIIVYFRDDAQKGAQPSRTSVPSMDLLFY